MSGYREGMEAIVSQLAEGHLETLLSCQLTGLRLKIPAQKYGDGTILWRSERFGKDLESAQWAGVIFAVTKCVSARILCTKWDSSGTSLISPI